MRKAFRASKLTGLGALVFGLMVFIATAAQAEPGAFWLVNGAKVTNPLLPEIQVKKDTPHGIFLTKVGLSKVEILCTEIKFVGAKLHESGRGTGKVHVEGCITKLNGTVAAACKPKSPGASLGLIETNALELLIKLHELSLGVKDGVLEVKPAVAGLFLTLELGASCAIGNKINISGVGFMKDCQNEGLVDKVEHLFEEGPLSALLFGANPATIDGSAWAFLAGAHTGMTFSGQPA
jgi:hypothetical protein